MASVEARIRAAFCYGRANRKWQDVCEELLGDGRDDVLLNALEERIIKRVANAARNVDDDLYGWTTFKKFADKIEGK